MSNEVPKERCDELMDHIRGAMLVVAVGCESRIGTLPCINCAANAFGGILAVLEFHDDDMDRVRSSWAKHVLEREMRKGGDDDE